MNSDDCSISQECISGNYLTSPSLLNTTCNLGVVNPVLIMEDTTASITLPECENGKIQDDILAVAERSNTTAASTLKQEYCFSNKQSNSLTPANDISAGEKHLFPSNQDPDVSDKHDNTDNFNQTESINELVTLNNNDNAQLCNFQDVRDVTETALLSLPEGFKNVVAMEVDQGGPQPQFSEIKIDSVANEELVAFTSEPNHTSFIGPILPSGWGQDAVGVCDDTSLLVQDIGFSCARKENTTFINDSGYNLSVNSVPKLTTTASLEFLGVGSCDNFLRGCKWSPDGNCVLTNSNDNCLRLFYPFGNGSMDKFRDSQQMAARVRLKECSQINDFAWHPRMNSSQKDYCRIACTCSGIPIHLWDAATGHIVANYRAYDQFDEITAAYSLSFTLDGSNLYAGYNKTIRIFDTDYPVRSCRTVKTYNSQTKDGQTGIISCFAFSPVGSGLYVAGSYSRHIGIYDSACDKLVCLMQGQQGGVTHLMFSPDGTQLYSGGRKDAEILCWDVRNMDKILFSALRDVKTNQRMYFDLSQSGRYLVSGNNDGTVVFWDTLGSVQEIHGDLFLKPCSQFQAHGDCVNGVSFNHHYNMIATASGQRHFHNFDYDSSDSANDEDTHDAETWDFSLRLWQIPLLEL